MIKTKILKKIKKIDSHRARDDSPKAKRPSSIKNLNLIEKKGSRADEEPKKLDLKLKKKLKQGNDLPQ